MSLAYAILAALNDRECSGYDLAKSFEETIGYFWAATHQQIYRELSQLEKKGWIVSETVEQDNRPNKKLYALTPVGREAITDWIAQPSKLGKHKAEILVKLFAGNLVEPDVLKSELVRLRQVHRNQLKTYLAIEQEYFPDLTGCTYAGKCHYLTLRNGIRHEQNWIDWCDEAIAFLDLDATSAPPPNSAPQDKIPAS